MDWFLYYNGLRHESLKAIEILKKYFIEYIHNKKEIKVIIKK